MARSSHVDDIERLKTEFNEQKQEIKEQNEAELENLRRYCCTRMSSYKKTTRKFNYLILSHLYLKINVINFKLVI